MKKCVWSFGKISSLLLALTLILAGPAMAKTELKLALGDAANSPQWELGTRFAALMEAYTDGEVTVAVFPNSQLGSEQETVQNLRLGTLDFSVAAINNVTPFSPSVGLYTLPYMMLNLDDAVTLTQGPIGQGLVKRRSQNLVFGFWVGPTPVFES